MFSAPSFDVTLESGRDTRKADIDRRFDLRLAGDLFYSSFQAFVGSNEPGIPSAARLLLERLSTEGAHHLARRELVPKKFTLPPPRWGPAAPVGEVFARLVLRKLDRSGRLSAVRVRLLKEGADPITGTTEFDGSVVFSDVPLGNYRLELDPQQATRLGMRLAYPALIELTADGAVETEVIVELEGK